MTPEEFANLHAKSNANMPIHVKFIGQDSGKIGVPKKVSAHLFFFRNKSLS